MINVIPVKANKVITKSDDLMTCLKESLTELINGDVLVIASKVVAITQDRVYELTELKISDQSQELAVKYSMDPRLIQLILDESDEIIGGLPGVLLTSVDNNLVANAGVDKSNCGVSKVVAWPEKPYKAAENIRSELMKDYSLNDLGVIISDSHVSPMRQGVIGQAIGVAGLKPVENLIGRRDLFGYKLTYSKRAIADQLVTTAHLVSGESDERVPFVIIRGYEANFTNERVTHEEIYMPLTKCLFMNSIKEYYERSKP